MCYIDEPTKLETFCKLTSQFTHKSAINSGSHKKGRYIFRRYKPQKSYKMIVGEVFLTKILFATKKGMQRYIEGLKYNKTQ